MQRESIARSPSVRAAGSKRHLLGRRLDDLAAFDRDLLWEGLIPFEGKLPYADGMITRVKEFLMSELDQGPAGGEKDSER